MSSNYGNSPAKVGVASADSFSEEESPTRLGDQDREIESIKGAESKLGLIKKIKTEYIENPLIQAVDQQPEPIVKSQSSEIIKVRQATGGDMSTNQAASRHEEPVSQALAKSHASRDLGSLHNQENS